MVTGLEHDIHEYQKSQAQALTRIATALEKLVTMIEKGEVTITTYNGGNV